MKSDRDPHIGALIRDAIHSLRRQTDEATRIDRETENRTGCLAGYADMSGSAVISTEGVWFWFDSESESLRVINDERLITMAIVSITRKYPQLSDLLPQRSTTAVDCEACGGNGRLFCGSVYCYACAGLGWIERRMANGEKSTLPVDLPPAGGRGFGFEKPRNA
jgi:hypothetical protein